MKDKIIEALRRRFREEAYASKMGLKLLDLEPGRAVVEMPITPDMTNIFDMIHGGAIFSLIDEAFELSCNAHGTIAVALSMTVTYHHPPDSRGLLRAESREIHRARKTGTYDIRVTDGNQTLIASCRALAYRKNEKLPFLDVGDRT